MKHYNQLDGLRFVAILLVLIEHYAIFIGRYISAGYYGVDLFFVLSGFLITTILLESPETFSVAYKKFIGRRTLRIFPIYYLNILVLFLLGNEDIHKYLLYCLTYSYNYAWVYFNIPLNTITHFWSLCVEEQFYLFWPFIILGLRNHLKILKSILLIIILVCSVQLIFGIFPSVAPYNGVGLFPRANSLGIGAFGAIIVKERKNWMNVLDKKWIEYCGFYILIFFLVTDFRLKYLVCPLLSLFFILKATNKGFLINFINNFLNSKRVCYIGSISYGVYLYHVPLGNYFAKYIFDPLWNGINWNGLGMFRKLQWHPWIFAFPLFTWIAISVAGLSYKYIEKPILSYKDKWFQLRTSG